MTKMPEPDGYKYRDETGNWVRRALPYPFELKRDEVELTYTADQLKQAVRDALEEAAKVAEGYPKYGEATAEEIRAMKEPR